MRQKILKLTLCAVLLLAGQTSVLAFEHNYEQLYFRGTPNGWGTTEMKLVADYTWEAIQTFERGDADARFKFDVYGDWSANFGDNEGDHYADASGTDIYVNPTGTDQVNNTLRIQFNDNTRYYTIQPQSANAVIYPYVEGKAGFNSHELIGLFADVYADGAFVEQVEIESYYVYHNTWVPRIRAWLAEPGDYTVVIDEAAEGYHYAAEYSFSLAEPWEFHSQALEVAATESYATDWGRLFLRGTFNGWECAEMSLVDDYTWRAEVTFGGSSNERFKLDRYCDWSQNLGDNDDDGVGDWGGADISVMDDKAATITFDERTLTYKVEYEPPCGIENLRYVRDPREGGEGDHPLACVDGLWKGEITFNEYSTAFYLISGGSFPSDPDSITRYGDSDGDSVLEEGGDIIPAPAAGTFDLEVNFFTGEYSLTPTTNPYEAHFPSLYLRGTMNDWGATAMALTADWTWEVTIDAEANTELKFDVYGEWQQNYGDDNADGWCEQNGANIHIWDAGNYTIQFYDDDYTYLVVKN